MVADANNFVGNATKLYNSIESVRIVRGILDDDPINWEFSINDKILRIPAEKLETQIVFRSQFIRVFNYPAPTVKKEEWSAIIELLAKEKATVEENNEESDGVAIARQVFAEIKKLTITEDEELAIDGRCLLKKGKYLLLPYKKIEDIISDHKYNITANRLSPNMAKLGFKTDGTKHPILNKKEVRVWEFYPQNFDVVSI